MSFFSSLRRWWQPTEKRQNQARQRRKFLTFDVLERRDAPAATPFAVPTGITPDTGIVGDNLTNQAVITLQGQGTPGIQFNLYSGSTFVTRATVGADGTWSLQFPKTLGNATYNFRTVPVGNNDPTASGSIAVTVDTVKPVVKVAAQTTLPGSLPRFQVTATDLRGTQQVALDVDLNGNRLIEANELNNATATITSGQPVIVTLNSFPKLSTVYVRARVLDKAGNETATGLIAVKGPQPNKVSLSVPASTSDFVYYANVQVTPGINNGYQPTVTLDIDLNRNGVFDATEEYATATLDSAGRANIAMSGLVEGGYRVRVRSADRYGTPVNSATQVMVVRDINPVNAQPLTFERNAGQVLIPDGETDPNVAFVVRNKNGPPGYLSPNMLTLQVPRHDANGEVGLAAQRMLMVNGSPLARGIGQSGQSSFSNYFVHGQAITNVDHYGQVTFLDVYPNIDVRYRGDTGILAYDFLIQPGGTPDDIVLSFPDAVSVALDSLGRLVVDVGEGQVVTYSLPITYQVVGGVKQAVASQFVVNGNQVSFEVGAYDTSRTLYIDPYVFVNFLVSNGQDTANGLTQDSQGNLYLIGSSTGATYPRTSAFAANLGGSDVVVTKMNSAGRIIWSGYIGGDSNDFGNGIAVDSAGFVYITGETFSTSGFAGDIPFPVSFGTFPPNSIVTSDAFVTILNPNGTIFESTFLGKNGNDEGIAIALDGDEDIWITGNTGGGGAFPAPASNLGTPSGGHVFLTKYNRRDLNSATGYLFTLEIGGGIFTDTVASMVIDGLDQVYLVGNTSNGGFPVTANAYKSTLPSFFGSGWVIRLTDNGTLPPTQTYGTYLGGSSGFIPDNDATGIAVDSNFNIWVTGFTNTSDFFVPALTSGLRPTRLPPQLDYDAFVIELNVGATATTAIGTYYGNAFRDEIGVSIALDPRNNVYIYGEVDKIATDATAPAFFNRNPVQTYLPGNDTDAFLGIMNPTLTTLTLGTTIGGAGNEDVNPNLLVVSPAGTVFFAGTTTNTLSFQAQVQGAGASSTILGNSGTAAPVDIYVGRIGRAINQTLFQDIFEPNDTSDVAKSIDRYINAGRIPNLTTARKPSGLFDYDWYKVRPTQSGTLTVSLTDISVFAAGPQGNFGVGGDLHLFIYKRVNGFLYLLDKSTIANSGFQRVSVRVNQGDDIVIQVNPFNFTQAIYTMNVQLT